VWSDSKRQLWVGFWHSGESAVTIPRENLADFALPKSKAAAYSVYVDENDKVWVSDFIANAILRFDPATEKFESFPSNKTRRGRAARCSAVPRGVGAESGTDRWWWSVLRFGACGGS